MRSFLTVSLAAAIPTAVAQDVTPKPAAVHVAAPLGALGARATPYPIAGAGRVIGSPYRIAGPRAVVSPYAVAPRVTYSPYRIVSAPAPAPKPAPVVPPPTPNPKESLEHAEDYAFWRSSYLNKLSEKENTLASSPVFEWKKRDGTMWRDLGPGRNELLNMIELSEQKYISQAAANELNLAAMLGAPDEMLEELHAAYAYEQQAMQQLYLENFFNDNGEADSQINMLGYQIARKDYMDDSAEALATMQAAKDAKEKQSAMVDMAVAQFDYLDALGTVIGKDFNINSKLMDSLTYQQDSYSVQSKQAKFDKAEKAYKADPSSKNLYKMQIAELELEGAEADYMSSLSAMTSAFSSSMSSLLGGNYALAMSYKANLVDAKIADLEEKLEAELYKEKYGTYPYSRIDNLPSVETQQTWYWTLG